MKKHKIVVVGAGTGGLSVLRNLHRRRKDLQITLIEPNEDHYYQPLWTLVGAGVFPLERSRRKLKDFLPADVEWIRDRVKSFSPDQNSLMLSGGETVQYDFLVVAAGLQLDWNKVEGLVDTLGKNGVCSNYSKESVEYTWECMRNFRGGKAVFTFPNTPIKCAGAPQKVMYLAEETFRNNGVRDQSEVKFVSAGAAIFGVQKYKVALEKIVQKRKIGTLFKMNLVKVDGARKIATFQNIESGELYHEEFDMLHVTPPMSAPDFIKASPLANEAGWVEVDKHSTRHVRYPNVFALGDVSSLPNSKTGAAIRRQGPVLVSHLLATIEGKVSSESYNGYASCPLITGRGKCILAEFDYDGIPDETFPFDQAKERRSMYWLKKYFIPFMYWKAMMKGFF